MVDVHPLGAREEPVKSQHVQAHGVGRGARGRRFGKRAREDRMPEAVRPHLDRVVADRAQRAEALDHGRVLVELVAAGEAGYQRRSPFSV
jgi:hypothetical protein